MRPRHGQARQRKETRPGRRLLATAIVAMTTGSLTAVATPAAAATTWRQVSAGAYHTCGITSSHDLWCWGDNRYGQLGTGNTTLTRVPVRIGTKGIWASVSAGGFHTCALDRDGTRYCWGSNASGQLGYDDTKQRLKPEAADSTWTMISAASQHTCGILTNRRAYCWGYDRYGQLGDGSAGGNQPSVQRVKFDGRWSAITTSHDLTCGLDSEGTRYCWGDNRNGALGLNKSAEYLSTPTTTANDGNWRTVDVGERAGCGISTGRFLYCWGYNPDGQLGVGDYENRSEPTRVTGRNWAQVSMGTSHTCGIKTDGIGYCWGANPYGQLGIGSTLVSPNTPRMIDEFDLLGRPIEDPMTWSSLSAGGGHTCGIRTDGILFCWGYNSYGQLGTGTIGNGYYPREVA